MKQNTAGGELVPLLEYAVVPQGTADFEAVQSLVKNKKQFNPKTNQSCAGLFQGCARKMVSKRFLRPLDMYSPHEPVLSEIKTQMRISGCSGL